MGVARLFWVVLCVVLGVLYCAWGIVNYILGIVYYMLYVGYWVCCMLCGMCYILYIVYIVLYIYILGELVLSLSFILSFSLFYSLSLSLLFFLSLILSLSVFFRARGTLPSLGYMAPRPLSSGILCECNVISWFSCKIGEKELIYKASEISIIWRPYLLFEDICHNFLNS